MSDTRTLVIENESTDDPRRLGDWLTEGGLTLEVCRPYTGDPVPADLSGYAALVVLGGPQDAFPAADGTPGAPWFPALEGLLRKAVRHRVPTLAICLGAQLLATAHGGRVERSPAGPQIGPDLVGRRDAATRDPLWRDMPLLPDVLHWHHDEITELPLGAVLLAAAPRVPHQAFRLGSRAWGTQFHIECDTAMIAGWVSRNGPLLDELELAPQEVIDACTAVLPDLAEVWQPFAHRFAALVRGELAEDPTALPDGPRQLPLLGG